MTTAVRAWEVHEDGTMTPVTVTGMSVWPGYVRVERRDGTIGAAYLRNLVSHATGERLTRQEVTG